MEAKLPAKGEWFTRSNRGSAAAARYADRPTDTIRVADVNEAAGEIHCERFDGFDAAGAMVIGRRTTIRFATWLSDAGRYTPCDPPAAPVPEMLDRQEAEARLSSPPNGLMPPTAEQIATMLSSPRAAIADMVSMFRADSLTDDAIDSDWEMVILRAHVRWLDAQAAPPVAVFVPPEPTMADLKAEIAACRADVAGLRGDLKALTEALKAAVPQMRLFPVAA